MNSTLKGVQKVLASLTMTVTVLGLGGFAALTPAAALAATPADYGLREGDTISADGTAGTAGYDPDIYIVNELGYKRLFVNPAIFTLYGHLSWAGVKHVAPATRDAFPTSGLFRNCESGAQAVYGLEVVSEDVAVLHWINITGAQAVSEDANFFKKVFCINNAEQNLYTMGSTYTSLSQVPDYARGGTGSPTPTPSSTGLNGSVGSLDSADYIGSLNAEEVGEGENNVPVVGLDLDVDSGSDIRLLAVKVAFREDADGAASVDLDDYTDEVSVWLDGDEVGSMDVSDMDEDSDVWSGTVILDSDAIIRMGETEDLRVAVSALGTIDSTDLGADAWEVAIESLRFVDAQGAITTENALEDIGPLNTEDDVTTDNAANRPFDFVNFATAADLELELNEASDNPDSRLVNIDNTSTTDDVVLLTGNLDATGDITVKSLIVHVATAGAAFDAIADNISMEVDGDVIETLQSTECVETAEVAVCTFNDFADFTINDGDRVKFRVLADINGDDDITSTTTPTLTATMESDADIVAEDEQGTTLVAGDKTGTANGEEQGFADEGIQVAFVSASESKTAPDTGDDIGTFVIKFDVTSFDTNAYVDNTCAVDASGNPPPAAADQGVIYGLASASQAANVINMACDLSAEASADETTNGNFEVLNGSTIEFTLTVTARASDSFVSMFLESINWASSDLAAAGQFYTFNLDEFETDTLFLEGE